jgi:hypothetical protein
MPKKKRNNPSSLSNLGTHAKKRAPSPPAELAEPAAAPDSEPAAAAAVAASVDSEGTTGGDETMHWHASTEEAEQAAAAVATPDDETAGPPLTRLAADPRRRRSSNEAELAAKAWPKSEWAERSAVSDVLGYIEERAGSAAHAPQLMCDLVSSKVATAALAAGGMATAVHKAIADGIADKIEAIKHASLHKDSTGRLVYDGILGAAVTGLKYVKHGARNLYAQALGISPRSMYYAREREAKLAHVDGVMLLDPRRARRKDALSVEKIKAIQACWEKETKQSPDKWPSVRLVLEDGTEVWHGIHWQQATDRTIFDLYCADPLNPVVGFTSFRLHKPYFIRKQGFRGCLCPKCHQMWLQLDGFRGVLAEASSQDNKCPCSFCCFHRDAARANDAIPESFEKVNYPPESMPRLMQAMFCPKPELRHGSGFKGTHYPVHSLNCIKHHLINWEETFVEGADGKANLAPASIATRSPKLVERNSYRLDLTGSIEYEQQDPDDTNDRCYPCKDSTRSFSCHVGDEKADDALCKCCGEGQFPITPPADCEFMKEGEVTVTEMVSVPRLNGKVNATREEACEKTKSRTDFLLGFKDYLSVYLHHKYTADWQDALAEQLIMIRKLRHQLIGWDFGMNYTCVSGEEEKGGFFEREQISLHTTLTYGDWPHDMLPLTYPDKKARAPRKMQIFIYFSDDKHHDATFVLDNAEHLLSYLHAQRHELGLEPLLGATILSDGGPGHYKQGRNFFNMTKLKVTHAPTIKPFSCKCDPPCMPPADAFTCPWTFAYEFLAPDHGKSAWDGITGVKKMQLMRAEAEGYAPPLTTAAKIVAYLQSRLRQRAPGHENAPFPVEARSSFSAENTQHILTNSEKLEQRRATEGEASTVQGTRSHYSFVFDAPGELRMRWLGCLCTACERGQPERCVQADMCGAHVERTVSVGERVGVRALDAHRRLQVKALAATVQIGDVIALLATEDVVPRRKFWLARVVQKPRAVTEAEGERVCPDTGDVFKGPSARSGSPGEIFIEVDWLECRSLAIEDDHVFVDEHVNGESLRGLVAVSLLRWRVCSAADWEGMASAPPSHARRSSRGATVARTATTESSQPQQYTLPAPLADAIVKSIRENFQDGLFVDGGNLRAGQVRPDEE